MKERFTNRIKFNGLSSFKKGVVHRGNGPFFSTPSPVLPSDYNQTCLQVGLLAKVSGTGTIPDFNKQGPAFKGDLDLGESVTPDVFTDVLTALYLKGKSSWTTTLKPGIFQ